MYWPSGDQCGFVKLEKIAPKFAVGLPSVPAASVEIRVTAPVTRSFTNQSAPLCG